jgi:hypothetical protein
MICTFPARSDTTKVEIGFDRHERRVVDEILFDLGPRAFADPGSMIWRDRASSMWRSTASSQYPSR